MSCFITQCLDSIHCHNLAKGRCKFQHNLQDYANLMEVQFYEKAFLIRDTCKGVDLKHCKKYKKCLFKHIDSLLSEFGRLKKENREIILKINKDYNRSLDIVNCLENIHKNPNESDNIIADFLKIYVPNKLTKNSGMTHDLVNSIYKSNKNLDINKFINNMKTMLYKLEKKQIKLNFILEDMKILVTKSENFITQLINDYDSEIIDITNSFNISLETAKKITAEREEKELCENHSLITVCEFTSQNNASCAICFSHIFPESDYDIIPTIPVKAIKDDDIIYCVECVKNMLKSSNLHNIGKEKIFLPGIKCPFANTKKNHNHRFSIIAITMALAQALPRNSAPEIYSLISNITANYHYEQTQDIIRKKISSIEKEGVTSVSYIVQQIQNRILIDTCPNCQRAYEFIGGCQSITCYDEYTKGGCGWNFCNVCLEHCEQYGDTHSHVAECIQSHGLNSVDSYFLSTSEGHNWRMSYRCKRIRKFLNSQPPGINYSGVLVVLYQNEKDLRPFLLNEFKDYSVDLKE